MSGAGVLRKQIPGERQRSAPHLKRLIKCSSEEEELRHFTGMKTLPYSEAALIVEVKQRTVGSGSTDPHPASSP